MVNPQTPVTNHGEGKTGVVPAGKVRIFSSLANPVFRLYFIGMLCQMASMSMQVVVTPLLVYRITGSATLLGIVALAGSLPHVFFSLFGGVIADRVHKKHILLIASGAFTVVALGLAVSLAFGVLTAKTWWILVINSVCQSSLMGILIPARHAIIPEIVGRERLMNAVALNSMGVSFLRLMAPAAAGFLIEGFGFKAVYFSMAGLYAACALFIAFMPLTGRLTPTTENPFEQLWTGLNYIRHQSAILLILVLTLFAVILSMPYQQLIAVFVDDILKVGAKGMGILMSASGVGAIAGSLVLASLSNKKRGLMLLLGTLFLGLALVGFSFSDSWTISLVMMVAIGVGHTARMTLSNILVQHYTADEYRGRVMGVYDMEMSFVGVGTFLAGLLTEAFNAQWAVGGFALLLVVFSLVALLFLPQIRNLD